MLMTYMALNAVRQEAWEKKQPGGQTRRSRFAALAPTGYGPWEFYTLGDCANGPPYMRRAVTSALSPSLQSRAGSLAQVSHYSLIHRELVLTVYCIPLGSSTTVTFSRIFLVRFTQQIFGTVFPCSRE